MNILLIIAACLAFLLGLAHSVVGEKVIFSKWRSGAVSVDLSRKQKVAFWVNWHLATAFLWGLTAILFKLATSVPEMTSLEIFVKNAIIISIGGAGIGACIVTRGKHPGWIILVAIAVLTFFG